MKGKINILLFLLFLFPALVEAKIPDAEEVFQNLLDAENTVSFVGKRLVVDWEFPPHSITMEELIIKKAPDKVIIEILVPWELRGKKIIRNAGRIWFENFEKDEFLPPPPPPEFSGRKTFFQDISLLRRNYNVTISMGNNHEPEALLNKSNIAKPKACVLIAGRKTYQIEIIPKYPGRPAKKLWLDAQKNVVLRMEDYSSDGRLISLLVYTEINFQPQIDEKLFAVPPSERNHRVREHKDEILSLAEAQKRSHFPIRVPQNLPVGFVFKGAHIKKMDGIQHVHLRYTDGLTTLSLFESEADDVNLWDKPPPKVEHRQVEEIFIGKVNCKIVSPPGRVRILHWTTNPVPEHDVGLSFTLIGEISKSEMIAVAESLILGEKEMIR